MMTGAGEQMERFVTGSDILWSNYEFEAARANRYRAALERIIKEKRNFFDDAEVMVKIAKEALSGEEKA